MRVNNTDNTYGKSAVVSQERAECLTRGVGNFFLAVYDESDRGNHRTIESFGQIDMSTTYCQYHPSFNLFIGVSSEAYGLEILGPPVDKIKISDKFLPTVFFGI